MRLLPKITPATALFSVNTFAGAMLALYIGFALGLPRPYWAMTTAFVVSQPLAGAVRSKAVFRLLGTLLGAAATVVLIPPLAGAPVLLCLALALWVGGCLTVSLLDRTPRSYLLMLAGYTAAIIGFPSVEHPEAVFDVAASRVVEIGLGIVCATLVHSLVFPRAVGEVLQDRIAVWLADADQWALDLLRGAGERADARDRVRLAAAASEIHILSSHLPFDTSHMRDTRAAVYALHDRMLLLIPFLSGLSDRIGDLGGPSGRGLPASVAEALGDMGRWIEQGADPDAVPRLLARLDRPVQDDPALDGRGLLIDGVRARAADVVRALGESHALAACLRDPGARPPAPVAAILASASRQPLHSDLGLAVRSGIAAALALLITCALWIGLGWSDGAWAAAMAAVFCCLFAALDDPAPAIVNFGAFFLFGLPLAALYLFIVLPAVDGFPMLVLTTAPPLLVLGLYLADPRQGLSAVSMMMSFGSALALQETFSPDFAAFANGNLAQFVGILTAVMVTRAVRSMNAEASVRRLRRQTWKALARLTRARAAPDPSAFAAQMVDRLALLAPKLAGFGEEGQMTGDRALRDLRVGMDLVDLQRARPDLTAEPRQRIEQVLAEVGGYFAGQAADGPSRPARALLRRIDDALTQFHGPASPAMRRSGAALVSLRRDLFADATPLAAAPQPEGAA